MKLGFYYHIPVSFSQMGELKTHGALGIFLDEIAKNVDHLTLFMHSAGNNESSELSYVLVSKNITFIDLGRKSNFAARVIWGNNIIRRYANKIHDLDLFIVRAPTPLGPALYKVFNRRFPVVFLFVGDYMEGLKHQKFNPIKKTLISIFTRSYERKQNRILSNCSVFVNSKVLLEKYRSIAKSVTEVKTTTLRESDFFVREDTCINKIISILFVGRLDPTKGINELIEAGALLNEKGVCFKINIVGDLVNSEEYVSGFSSKISKLKLTENISFEGHKTIGPELNRYYRDADIFVLPSYHEGFPRTIWEAMANSIPVIATTVGSISFNLENNQDAILIEPKSSKQISDAIERYITDMELRKRVIKNGFKKAETMKIEIQTKEFINHLSEIL